jgi:AcrR family transcriptional regulator
MGQPTGADTAPTDGDGSASGDGVPPSGRRRPRKDRRRRREIIDAAAEVFFEKGYETTSTKDIAESVGLLKGSLYYYVDSKEDFLFEIVSEIHEGALQLLQKVRVVEGTAYEQLLELIRLHVVYHTANLVKTMVFFREFRHLSPERQAIINREGDSYLSTVRELVELGQKEGTIRADLDPRITSRAIVGLLNSLHLWYVPGGPNSSEQIADVFLSLLVSGFASPAGPDTMAAVGANPSGNSQ